MAGDGAGGLYVADENSQRVLHYSQGSVSADGVWGQPDSTGSMANFAGVNAVGLDLPISVAVDTSGDLLVADAGNSRVLSYPAAAPSQPVISGISTTPNPPVAGQQFSFTITGTNFNPATALVNFNGPGCAPPFPCAAQLASATSTASQLVGSVTLPMAGAFTVTVQNGTAGTASNSVSLTVMPAVSSSPPPAISGIATNPNPPVAGQVFSLTISGSNFNPATAVVNFSGPNCSPCVAQFLSPNTATQIGGTMTLQTAGSYTVAVQNGTAGTSSGFPLTVSSASSGPGPTPTGPQILSYVQFGGDWSTSLQIVNPTSASTTFLLRFRGSGGSAASVPVTQSGPTQGSLGNITQISATLASGAIATYTLGGANSTIVYAQLDSGTVQIHAFSQNTLAPPAQLPSFSCAPNCRRVAQVGISSCPVTSVLPFDLSDPTNQDMALGVVNPSGTNANLTISTQFDNGAGPGGSLQFSAGRQAVNKIEETRVFPFGTNLFGRRGTLTFQSDGPGVCVVGLPLGFSIGVVPAFSR